MDKIKVLLFAMTGFGNNTLKVLKEQPCIEILGVFTPGREKKSFPYYKCEHLQDVVMKSDITLYEDLLLKEEDIQKLIKKLFPDLIIVSSFKQKIPQAVLSIPKLGVINIHPSLLPKYRGPTPTTWVLINGEKETGVTIHFIENEMIDSGKIITQGKVGVDSHDTDGNLRFKLAEFSEGLLKNALQLIQEKNKEEFPLQNESEASYYPRCTVKDYEINLNEPFVNILNRIKAMLPYPGPRLEYKNKRYIIKDAFLLGKEMYDENLGESGDVLVVNSSEGKIRFQVINL